MISVKVVDPRLDGKWRDPFLKFDSEMEITELNEPIYIKGGTFRVISCGLFYAVEKEVTGDGDVKEWTDIDPSEINVVNASPDFHGQLIHTVVSTPLEPELDLYASIQRMRRMLKKKTDGAYKIRVDENAAMTGKVKWMLDRTDPTCYGGARPASARCPEVPVSTIVYRNTHLPLCAKHASHHDARFAHNRTNSPKG